MFIGLPLSINAGPVQVLCKEPDDLRDSFDELIVTCFDTAHNTRIFVGKVRKSHEKSRE